MRRSQITLFMIVALLVLFAFLFLFFINARISKLKLEQKADEIAKETVENEAFRNYVTLCMKRSLEISRL